MIREPIDLRFACKSLKQRDDKYARGLRITQAQLPTLVGTIDLKASSGIKYIGDHEQNIF